MSQQLQNPQRPATTERGSRQRGEPAREYQHPVQEYQHPPVQPVQGQQPPAGVDPQAWGWLKKVGRALKKVGKKVVKGVKTVGSLVGTIAEIASTVRGFSGMAPQQLAQTNAQGFGFDFSRYILTTVPQLVSVVDDVIRSTRQELNQAMREEFGDPSAQPFGQPAVPQF
ncbi:hypothetical protein ACOZ4N_10625 [Halorientalis pallida]|uniref:hypothetical protein n=1 Tax=Halorientalis pallida TaxID=2479928 RepID=UPI003C6EF696